MVCRQHSMKQINAVIAAIHFPEPGRADAACRHLELPEFSRCKCDHPGDRAEKGLPLIAAESCSIDSKVHRSNAEA
jgi:hypothetical protein